MENVLYDDDVVTAHDAQQHHHHHHHHRHRQAAAAAEQNHSPLYSTDPDDVLVCGVRHPVRPLYWLDRAGSISAMAETLYDGKPSQQMPFAAALHDHMAHYCSAYAPGAGRLGEPMLIAQLGDWGGANTGPDRHRCILRVSAVIFTCSEQLVANMCASDDEYIPILNNTAFLIILSHISIRRAKTPADQMPFGELVVPAASCAVLTLDDFLSLADEADRISSLSAVNKESHRFANFSVILPLIFAIKSIGIISQLPSPADAIFTCNFITHAMSGVFFIMQYSSATAKKHASDYLMDFEAELGEIFNFIDNNIDSYYQHVQAFLSKTSVPLPSAAATTTAATTTTSAGIRMTAAAVRVAAAAAAAIQTSTATYTTHQVPASNSFINVAMLETTRTSLRADGENLSMLNVVKGIGTGTTCLQRGTSPAQLFNRFPEMLRCARLLLSVVIESVTRMTPSQSGIIRDSVTTTRVALKASRASCWLKRCSPPPCLHDTTTTTVSVQGGNEEEKENVVVVHDENGTHAHFSNDKAVGGAGVISTMAPSTATATAIAMDANDTNGDANAASSRTKKRSHGAILADVDDDEGGGGGGGGGGGVSAGANPPKRRPQYIRTRTGRLMQVKVRQQRPTRSSSSTATTTTTTTTTTTAVAEAADCLEEIQDDDHHYFQQQQQASQPHAQYGPVPPSDLNRGQHPHFEYIYDTDNMHTPTTLNQHGLSSPPPLLLFDECAHDRIEDDQQQQQQQHQQQQHHQHYHHEDDHEFSPMGMPLYASPSFDATTWFETPASLLLQNDEYTQPQPPPLSTTGHHIATEAPFPGVSMPPLLSSSSSSSSSSYSYSSSSLSSSSMSAVLLEDDACTLVQLSNYQQQHPAVVSFGNIGLETEEEQQQEEEEEEERAAHIIMHHNNGRLHLSSSSSSGSSSRALASNSCHVAASADARVAISTNSPLSPTSVVPVVGGIQLATAHRRLHHQSTTTTTTTNAPTTSPMCVVDVDVDIDAPTVHHTLPFNREANEPVSVGVFNQHPRLPSSVRLRK